MAPNNTLTCWGNEKTMNLNTLILTNIQSSPYFKVNLYELKTYHEVIDEIYYKVSHLEPWEKGSRKTAGQTGMCGGVRGVGAGGIVSSAYCLLYKLFTLKLTRKQVTGLIEHADSPYIRGLGFMYIRYTQDPKEIWDWYEPYFDDDEEVDVKAGGGHVMTIGEIVRQWMTKLEWYCTLFPRIPVPVQKDIDRKMKEYLALQAPPPPEPEPVVARHIPDEDVNFGEAEKYSANAAIRKRSPTPPFRARVKSPPRHRSPPRRRSTSPPRQRSHRSPRRSPPRRSPPRRRRSPPSYRPRSPRRRSPSPRRRSPDDFANELQREKERQLREKESPKIRELSREKERRRSKSRSRDQHRHSKHRSRSRDRKRSRSRDRKRSRSRSPHKKKHKSHKERRRSRSHSRHRNGVQ